MIELRDDRAPSSNVQYVLSDCAVRDADYRRDKAFSDIKPSLRMELWKEQGGLCVYCERRLPSHAEMRRHHELIAPRETRVEHIRPRSRFPERTFDYQNLALSCSNTKSCDHRKKNHQLENTPKPGVNARFALKTDGKLVAIGTRAEKQARRRDLEDILSLNSPALLEARREIIENLGAVLSAGTIREDDVTVFIEESEFRDTLRHWWGAEA